MKKQLAFLGAAVFAVSALLVRPISVEAVGTDAASYEVRMEAERNFVTAEEVAEGDVTIQAAVYLSGSTANTFSSIVLEYEDETDTLHFQNLVTGDVYQSEATTYESSQGTFTTNYVPYCFGYLKRGNYYSGSPTYMTYAYSYDRKTGAMLYSAGEGKIQFTYSCYLSAADYANGVKTTVTQVCDVTVQEDGSGVYTYEYTGQLSTTPYETETVTVTISNYDPTTPEGDPILGECNYVSWIAGTSQLTTGASFFGDTSDEFPLFYVDIVIPQGTEPGIYSVDFVTDSCELVNAENQYYSFVTTGCSIAVGVDSVAVTAADMDSAGYYASYDTHAIRATDFASSILATVTYANADGTIFTEENVDITNLVDCYDVTPAELYAQRAQNGYYLSENQPLYCNEELLKWSDGSRVTQKIMVGMKGDVDYDGVVTLTDAYLTLCYYAQSSVGLDVSLYTGDSTDPDMETLTFYLADVDTCSKHQTENGASIGIDDAYYILYYYARNSVGIYDAWDSFRT